MLHKAEHHARVLAYEQTPRHHAHAYVRSGQDGGSAGCGLARPGTEGLEEETTEEKAKGSGQRPEAEPHAIPDELYDRSTGHLSGAHLAWLSKWLR